MAWPLGWTILPPLFPGGDCRAAGISWNGARIVGQAWDATRDNSYAAYWTEAGIVNAGRLSPADGGDPDEDVAKFSAASYDGSTIVGTSDGVGNDGTDDGFWQAIVWTTAGGLRNISPPTAGFSEASSVTPGGDTVAGYTQLTRGVSTSYRSFIWTQAGGLVTLPLPAGFTHTHWCKISPAAQWLIGGVGYTGTSLFRWSASTGSVPVTDTRPDVGYTNFPRINDDGTFWVGGQSNVDRHAKLWHFTNTLNATIDLGLLPGGTYAYALCNTLDGSVAAGYADDAAGNVVAIRWTALSGMVAIPLPPGYNDVAPAEDEGLSADGSIFAGYITDNSGVEHAFIYRADTMPRLTDSELFFKTTDVFVDFNDSANRRKFVSDDSTPQWLGGHGEIPFHGSPSIYLNTMGPPPNFATNNGNGGSFQVQSGTIDPSGTAPGCSFPVIDEIANAAPRDGWRLSVSDDGAQTWNRLVKPRSIGAEGDYLRRLRWLKMGQSRERVLKLECTDPVRRNIIGIYIDGAEGMS